MVVLCEKLNQIALKQGIDDVVNGNTVSCVLRNIIKILGPQPYGVLSDYLSCIYSFNNPIEIMNILDPWCGYFDYGMSDDELDKRFSQLIEKSRGQD